MTWIASNEINDELYHQYPLGVDLECTAEHYGESPKEFMRRLLNSPAKVMIRESAKKDDMTQVLFLPGGALNGGAVGPRRKYPVMFIGKMPKRVEVQAGRSFVGAEASLMTGILQELGIRPEVCYATNALRFEAPGGGNVAKPFHVAMCTPLLVQEVSMVYPQVIVLLGADAVKAVFGRKMRLEDVRSAVFALEHPGQTGCLIPKPWSEDMVDAVKVVATIHPAAVLKEEGYREGFVSDLHLLGQLLGGEYAPLAVGAGCDYRYVRDAKALSAVVDEVINSPADVIAVDCEWGGAGNGSEFWRKDSCLRSIQFSWKHGSACVAVLRECGGGLCCTPDEPSMLAEIRRLISCPKIRVTGHNLRADALWLEDRGIPVMKKLIFDSMLADWVLHENAEHGLEVCTSKFTDMGRYDLELTHWCKRNKYGKKKVKAFGYRDIPDAVLEPYAAADADASLRLYHTYQKTLAERGNEGVRQCYDVQTLSCCAPIHEIEYTGIHADKDRLIELVHVYDARKDEVAAQIQALLGRTDFNPRSTPQMQDLLFGEKGFGYEPVKTTEKPARMWADAMSRASEEEKRRLSPAVDTDTLEALATKYPENKVLSKLVDFKVLDQVTKNFLPMPVSRNGIIQYVKGLPGCVAEDGRIRLSINQMSETGRHKHSNPNLAQIPKKQEKNMQRLVGKDTPTIRSCLMATPGWILIESDYKSAEIFTLGYLSGCDKLIKDACTDLHARVAVNCFGAPKWDGFDDNKKPPKEWLDEHEAIRISGKTINFGLAYQRGAAAIARQILKDTAGKVACTRERAQEVVDLFYDTYSEVRDYVEYCKGRVLEPGWIETPYGRRRRFVQQGEQSFIAAQQRECVNFVIQSTVADTLNTALINFWWWRRLNPGQAEYRILLPVHDAVMLECRPSDLETVLDRVIPECMVTGAVVPAWRPDGMPARRSFRLETDVKFGLRWGEHADPETMLKLGVPSHIVERNH